jgi:hypothetical protein
MSNRYFGGIISATKITTSGTTYTGSASGIWNLVQQARQKQLNAWPKGKGISEPLDPPVSSVTAGNEVATIAFTAPQDNGGDAVIGYIATANPGNITSTAATSPITIYGLTNDQIYYISVAATNSFGSTLKSTPYPITPTNTLGTTIPSKPTNVSASVGGGYALITFTTPSSIGSSAISSYRVISSPDGLVNTGTTTSIPIYGLVPGKSYTFRVIAINTQGSSAPSLPSNSVIPTLPGKPSSPTITSAVFGNTQATIYFNPSADLGGSACTYTITSSPSGKTASGLSSPIIVTGLINGVTYTFTMTAANSIGISDKSNVSSFVVPATIPSTPVITSVTAGDSQINVFFRIPINGGSIISNYRVTSSGGQIANGTTSPITVTGLTNNTSYTFTMLATNAIGNSLVSNTSLSIKPVGAPPVPPIAYATSINSSTTQSFVLNWDTNSGYTYTVWSTGGQVSGVTTSGSTILYQYGTTILEPDSSYTFYVRATNAYGSVYSNSVSVTIPKAAVALNITGTSVPLVINSTWAANQGWSLANQAKPAEVTINITGTCTSQYYNTSSTYNTNSNYSTYTLMIQLTGLHASSTITINVNSEIRGIYADYAYYYDSGWWRRSGYDGGPALYIACNKNVTLYNYSTIGGAGGGGGVGGAGLN